MYPIYVLFPVLDRWKLYLKTATYVIWHYLWLQPGIRRKRLEAVQAAQSHSLISVSGERRVSEH